MSNITHPTPLQITRGSRLWHLKTDSWVTLCNCASVSHYRKVGWAKAHPSEYSLVKPTAEVVAEPVVQAAVEVAVQAPVEAVIEPVLVQEQPTEEVANVEIPL
jgi:hypothetical protein